MPAPSGLAVKWAAAGLGGIAGFLVACYIGVYLGPLFDDFQARLSTGQFDYFKLSISVAMGAILGYLAGRQVVQGWAATRPAGPSVNPWSAALAVGAVAWLLLASLVGVAVGGELADANPLGRRFPPGSLVSAPYEAEVGGFSPDRHVRRRRHRWGGALVGAWVGYGLLALAVKTKPPNRSDLLASNAALAAENERLRHEVARLREGRA
jgi:hypothetical protein